MAKSRKQRKKSRHKGTLDGKPARFTARGKPYAVREPEEEPDPRLMDLRSQIAPLRAALRPFARVPLPGDEDYKGLPTGDAAWVYLGRSDPVAGQGSEAPHFTIGDLQRARTALRV